MKSNDQLLTVKEAAEYLRVSIWTLYRWQGQKHIPVIKIGGVNRFRKNEIDQWLSNFKHN